ncbi:N-acetylmuramoyl-L-alanine amidase [Manganibacter manganicus]|uniref:N-acetylmuramoyl-L-alanine amidase n=1 Tax=Manganibacter manganicus TaxID=1873176 RepID=A0A1V8RTV7_9HYPH|nr:N-acetylmuramoyl-L-alanine amidase [Pseudaminobacter manganicus]OQM76573.1 N-acetylmuramoyl-L-alanine amidase [Pseudaminobacter manganicus]
MGLTAIVNKDGRPGGLLRLAAMLCLITALFASFCASASAAEAPIHGTAFSITGDASRMRVAMNFDREPNIRWFLLRAPHRMVIDLPDTRLALDPKALKSHGLIKTVRYGTVAHGASRLIITGEGPFVVDRVDVLKNEDDSGYRVTADIKAASEREFAEALSVQAQTTGSTVSTDKGARIGKAADERHRFTVVIDPGHGGIDGGAESPDGTIEKDVTLAFAAQLRDKLAATGRYDVFMTRDSDIFLGLDERVDIARRHAADLFISIHADTIRVKSLRGATVYTVSDKASDAESEALANRENLSDQLAGIEVKEERREVADILIDLIRRETHKFSMRFADTLVHKLSDVIGMINNPHRYAGFRVLKAPDVPSVLVELGYLSNAKDEAQLNDPAWRDKTAQSIADAIALFATRRTAMGG